MAERRQFLLGGLVGSVLLTSFSVRAATRLTSSASARLAAFDFDQRFEYGAALAHQLGQDAIQIYAIRGDVAEVWYDHLSPQLRASARSISGLTTAGGLFVLTRLGHDAGLTLAIYGTDRLAVDDPEERHVLDGPDGAKRRFDSALTSRMFWPAALQGAFLEVAAELSADRLDPADVEAAHKTAEMTLHSWLLAPRS